MEIDVDVQFHVEHGWRILFATYCFLNCFYVLISRIMTIFIFRLEHGLVHHKSETKLHKTYLWNILYESGYALFLQAAHTQAEYLS